MRRNVAEMLPLPKSFLYKLELLVIEIPDGFSRYRTPPWMSLVLLLLVPLLKSSLSIKVTLRPLVTVSKAIPVPVAPPPMMSKSYILSSLDELFCLALG